MTTRADRLTAFLERFEGKPVVWGLDDCSAAPALWLAEETGIRVKLPDYATKEAAYAQIAKVGGLVNLWSARLELPERIGFPHLGDVGVIDMRRTGPVGVIFGTSGVAFPRAEKGGWGMLVPRSYLKVWAID